MRDGTVYKYCCVIQTMYNEKNALCNYVQSSNIDEQLAPLFVLPFSFFMLPGMVLIIYKFPYVVLLNIQVHIFHPGKVHNFVKINLRQFA